MTKKLYNDIIKWQNKTFPIGNEIAFANKLKEEVDELIFSIENDNPFSKDNTVGKELADCFIVLIGLCGRFGLSYEAVEELILLKHGINQNRTWGKPDGNGVVKHTEG